jgi:hypothetical protein
LPAVPGTWPSLFVRSSFAPEFCWAFPGTQLAPASPGACPSELMRQLHLSSEGHAGALVCPAWQIARQFGLPSSRHADQDGTWQLLACSPGRACAVLTQQQLCQHDTHPHGTVPACFA